MSIEPNLKDDDYVSTGMLKKYELTQKLGHSAFGVVWYATDKLSRQPVALKKLYGAYNNATRAQMAYREIHILERLQGHEHIVKLRSVVSDSEAPEGESHLYLVFDIWEADLYCAIRAGVIELKHHSYITCQISRALDYVHALGFVHRDVKPSNILINGKCQVKLCDFGHARSLHSLDAPCSHNNVGGSLTTDYLGSRWYRAPESLLGTTRITMAVDIWALGCILAELMLGKPLFQGHSTTNQLWLILQVIGFPTPEEIEGLRAPTAKEQLGPDIIGEVYPMALSEVFPAATAESLDFIRLCLQFDPNRRITANDASKHPYVIEFFHENFELIKKFKSAEPLYLDDNVLHTAAEYKLLIDKNIQSRSARIRHNLGVKERFGNNIKS